MLGSGGFGEVVLARQSSVNRLVAIKRIHGYALADAGALERFHREAKVLAALNHPGVVRVFDFRREGADATLIMEYVAGQSLSEQLAQGGLPISAALTTLGDVAEALKAAAAHGVAHRDVKPDNVFVLPNCRAKLGDFGLARIVSDPSVFRTADGVATGTPAYFPPESGLAGTEPDEHSDAYSFAVMAYEVLTGELPFSGLGMLDMIAAHISRPPPPPTAVAPGFPLAASEALLAGLTKDPRSRLLPAELVARLAAVPPAQWPARPEPSGSARSRPTVRSSPPVKAQPIRPPPPRRAGSRRLAAAVAAAATLAAAAAGVAFLVATPSAEPAGPLRVQSISHTVVPSSGRARCPSAQFEFAATLKTNGQSGSLRIRWTRPDGRQTDPVTLRVTRGQRTITALLRFDVTGAEPLTGAAVFHVLTPRPQEQTSREIRYEC